MSETPELVTCPRCSGYKLVTLFGRSGMVSKVKCPRCYGAGRVPFDQNHPRSVLANLRNPKGDE